MFTLFVLALGARIVRNDFAAGPPSRQTMDAANPPNAPVPKPAVNPHDVSEITKDVEEIVKIAKDAATDVGLVEHGDLTPDDVADIVKEVTTDAGAVKGIVHDVFGKGGLLSRAKQGLKDIKDKRKDFCWWSIHRRPTVAIPKAEDVEEAQPGCFSGFCQLFRRHKKFEQCPAGLKTFKLDKAWCHTKCHGDLPKSCGLGCVKAGRFTCAGVVLKDVEATGRLALDALAIVFPTPLTVGLDVAVSATLDSLHLVASAVMAGVDHSGKAGEAAHLKEAKFATAMLAVLHHAGDPKNWAELKSSAIAVKDDVHVKEYGQRAFTSFKASIKDTKSVVHLVYTAFHDSTLLQRLGKVAIGDTVAAGLLSIVSVFQAFVAPTCK